MRKSLLLFTALAVLAVGATTLAAQSTPVKPELRPFAGAMIPTGELRKLFRDAPMVGISPALELRPSFHVLGTFTWVPAQNKYGVAQDNVFCYRSPISGVSSKTRNDMGLAFGLAYHLR